MVESSDILLVLVALVFPPAAVAFVTGCSCDLLINILLTILGYLPGHIHALWLIYKLMKAKEQFANQGGFVYRGSGQYEPLIGDERQQGTVPPQQAHYAPAQTPAQPAYDQPPPSYGAVTNSK